MRFVLLFGPQAVGKMTVGQHLGKLTGMNLLHNHVTNDVITQYFGYDSQQYERLSTVFRHSIMKEFANSNKKGLMFTNCWAFDQQEDTDFINSCTQMFHEKNIPVYYIELRAPQDIRLQRNTSEHRLKHKPSKKNIKQSENKLIEYDDKYVFESPDGFFADKHHLIIDTTKNSAKESAQMIADFIAELEKPLNQ